ncbi:GNAT family N-acetyltransferase [Facilibium subflavum]|uniref:GNAT family N-acetyltransferase n=1 Tax=Facilibium subflavum TaxID=2219058 RepID=UPI000E659026|nr:GNAT family N-acetyltransferase [Facilibium subflavum]
MSISTDLSLVKFIKPTQKRLDILLKDAVNIYSNELVKSREFHDFNKAKNAASAEVNNLLNYCSSVHELSFYEIWYNQDNVGYIWFMEKSLRQAFLAYIYIDQAHRRKAYAQKALDFYENQALNIGAQESKLFVFKHNLQAIMLYKKAGYQISAEVGFYEAAQNSLASRLEMVKILI